MVGARSLAMALNRLIDARIDAANPRTAARELPSGALTAPAVLGVLRRSLALYAVAVFAARPARALALADPGRRVRRLPVPEALHVALPPLARRGRRARAGRRLGGDQGRRCRGRRGRSARAVAAWVAGFDLFYALFDVEVDREQGLHSWATRFGERGAFAGARVLHLATLALLVAAGLGLHVGCLYWLGVIAVAACSSTSTRSCAPATCAGSTPRSSR